jgi:plastocyanin
VRSDPLGIPGAYFTATATPGPLAAIQIHRVGQIMGGSAEYWSQGIPLDFGLTATDAYGNALRDVPITWSIAGGAGIPGSTAVTGPEGRVDVRVTPEEGYRGEIAVRAAAEGVESAPAHYPYTDFIIMDADGWGDYLNRSSATIQQGETVRWVNEGRETHTVAPATGGEGGAVIPRGSTFAHAFATSGTFQWACTQHGENFTITVTP